jgi:hypothetical protein
MFSFTLHPSTPFSFEDRQWVPEKQPISSSCSCGNTGWFGQAPGYIFGKASSLALNLHPSSHCLSSPFQSTPFSCRVVRLRRMISWEVRGRNLYNYVSEDEGILSVKKSLALAL